MSILLEVTDMNVHDVYPAEDVEVGFLARELGDIGAKELA